MAEDSDDEKREDKKKVLELRDACRVRGVEIRLKLEPHWTITSARRLT
jgi:hypothetical protein